MLYPAVSLKGQQTRSVGIGFANSLRKSTFTIWACSIPEEHVHLVIARQTYKVEQIGNQLKREAAKQLKVDSLRPSAEYQLRQGTTPTPWAAKCWKVILSSEDAIEHAIRYLQENHEN